MYVAGATSGAVAVAAAPNPRLAVLPQHLLEGVVGQQDHLPHPLRHVGCPELGPSQDGQPVVGFAIDIELLSDVFVAQDISGAVSPYEGEIVSLKEVS